MAKSLKAKPFTDTQLQEMAINFPEGSLSSLRIRVANINIFADESEMLEIPGISHDMVQLHSKKFLKLIREAQRSYEEMRQQEDRPQDPNHQNVINISSDEEQDNDGEFDDFDEEECSQGKSSAYFHQFKALDPVDAFNRQRKQTNNYMRFKN